MKFIHLKNFKNIAKIKKTFTRTFFAFTSLLALPLLAQETATSTSNASVTNTSETNTKAQMRRLETVNVNSGRSDRKLDVAGTVNTVRAIDMKQDAGSWIGETVNKLPGVFMAQLRGPVDAPAIRLPTVYNNYYLYLQDNIPFQSPIAYNHAAFSYSAAETSFGGIEILKGPGTAIHGSGAVAAVINVKSREPEDALSFNARLGGGAYFARDARVELTGGLGKYNALLGAFSYQGEEGWRSNSGWNRFQGILHHRLKVDGWEINTIGMGTYFSLKMTSPISQSLYNSNVFSDGLDADVSKPDATESETYLRLHSEIKKDFGNGVSLSLIPYVRSISGSYMEVWNPASTPIDTDKQITGGLMARAYFDFAPWSKLTIGADGDYTSYDYLSSQTRSNVTVYGFASPIGDHYKYHVNFLSGAPYAQYSLTFFERLILTAGLRFDALSYAYQNGVSSNSFGSYYRPADRSDVFTSLNPSAGLTLKITEEHSLFTRYAHSFRIPAASDLYNLDTSSAKFSLKPEQVDSGEIGYKASVGKILDIDLAGYYSYLRDGIIDLYTSAGSVKSNGGQSEFKGIEAGIRFQPVKDLEFTLSYAFSAHRIVKKIDGTVSAADGKVPTSAPQNLGYAQITWRPSFLPGFFLQPEMHWIGAWWMDEANTVQKPDDVVFNGRVGYLIPKTAILLNVKFLNILNRKYPATAEIPSWSYGVPYYRPAQAFTVVGGVEVSL